MKIMPLGLKFGWVSARSSVAISIRRRYLLITDLVLGLPTPLSLPYVHGGRGSGLYFTLVFSCKVFSTHDFGWFSSTNHKIKFLLGVTRFNWFGWAGQELISDRVAAGFSWFGSFGWTG